MKKLLAITVGMMAMQSFAQQPMTPETLWKLGRVTPIGISKDQKNVVYKVSTPQMDENKLQSKFYRIPIEGGQPVLIEKTDEWCTDKNLSSNGLWKLSDKAVKVNKVLGSDYYPQLQKSDAKIYDGLDYRHWDTYNDGTYNHVFITNQKDKSIEIDLLAGEPFDSPQKPHGGDEDYTWSPDSKKVVYVAKKLAGTAYAISTNTDLYEYDLETKTTKNLTPNNAGYDTHPLYSKQGTLAWLQMKRDGYEADKNDIIILKNNKTINLTQNWDETVMSFVWSDDEKKIYFIAPMKGTKQLFEVNTSGTPVVKQLTDGDFDVNEVVGFVGNKVVLARTDMNHAQEIFSYDLKSKQWNAITKTNQAIYDNIATSKTEKRWITTTDGKKMAVWVIYPPQFDPNKKYPALLYCQGGPQSALTQSYSFRWNFQVMAAQGYIVIAPNRRGMPGHGTAWNEQISKDWGGQVMQDYLSATDALAKEPYVDAKRMAAVGASYGGYSVFYLAGIHNNRFKTFISHCGVYNLQSMYGTTEEVFFNNFDHGGAYWESNNAAAQKTFKDFNPINLVNNWNTPILIIQGGKDYRVPIGQGQEAFQAAQLKGIKSRFMLFPEENHWVLKPQNALIWQGEFFRWLKETL